MGRIKKVSTGKELISDGMRAIAQVTGKEVVEREDIYFEDQQSGKKYVQVRGGIGVGGIGKGSFAAILGASRVENPEDRRVCCIAEAEFRDIDALAKGLKPLADEWIEPFEEFNWYSDMSLESYDRLYQLSKTIILSGNYYNSPEAFIQYMRSLEIYKPLLSAEACPLLRTYMANLQTDDIGSLDPEKWPAIAALAYGIDALMVRRPWEIPIAYGTPQRYVDFEEDD